MLVNKPIVIIGSDVYENKNALYMAKILSVLQQEGRIDVILISPMPNANGICNIIDFDDFIDGYSVGFRAKGDYVLDSIECDFALPYFSELENSVTNIDYKVLPLYPVDSRFDYLERLSSYLGLEFISDEVTLSNDYGNDGFYLRGVNAIPVIDSYVNDIFLWNLILLMQMLICEILFSIFIHIQNIVKICNAILEFILQKHI